MSATAIQALIGGVAALVGAYATVLVAYKNKRDRIAVVGAAFRETVQALSADDPVTKMAGAVLLRRFLDRDSEQAVRGLGGTYRKGTPYGKEAIEVIAGMLRETKPSPLQKVLADGLRYARDLRHADLQECELSSAYLGLRQGDAAGVDLSYADLYKAVCMGTSFKGAKAFRSTFFGANLEKAVFAEADCTGANFRDATLTNAKFTRAELKHADFSGATVSGARFTGATNIPPEVARFLDADGVAASDSVIPAQP